MYKVVFSHKQGVKMNFHCGVAGRARKDGDDPEFDNDPNNLLLSTEKPYVGDLTPEQLALLNDTHSHNQNWVFEVTEL